MIRRPPRSTLDRSSAASDVYKRQTQDQQDAGGAHVDDGVEHRAAGLDDAAAFLLLAPVSYTHLRAHETVLDLVCRLLLEKKKKPNQDNTQITLHIIHETKASMKTKHDKS